MAQLAQELAAFGRVVGLAGGQPTRYGRASIPGHQMNLGGPSRAGLADGVRAVFLAPPGPSGCTFPGGTIQRHGFDLETDNLIRLQRCEDSIQYTAFGPAIHAGVDRVPGAKTCGQAASCAALLGHVYDRVQHPQIGQAHVATLGW